MSFIANLFFVWIALFAVSFGYFLVSRILPFFRMGRSAMGAGRRLVNGEEGAGDVVASEIIDVVEDHFANVFSWKSLLNWAVIVISGALSALSLVLNIIDYAK